MATTESAQTEPAGKGLKAGPLGLLVGIVIGIASTAPAYSLAATLGFVVITENGGGIVGVKAPLIMLLAFIPMYLIAVAYPELNKAEPDCGTTFTWAARAFGPSTGWMGGWGIIAADVIVMANLAQIAGLLLASCSFGARRPRPASTFWSTVAGVVWIVVMTYICYRGIEVSARLQYALLGIEVVVLVVFAVVALVKVYTGNAPAGSLHPSLSLVLPVGLELRRASSTGALLGGLHLLGLGHRGRGQRGDRRTRRKTPGRAAVIVDAPAAGHLRARRPSPPWRSPASAPRASGWATRTTPTTCSRRIGHGGVRRQRARPASLCTC